MKEKKAENGMLVSIPNLFFVLLISIVLLTVVGNGVILVNLYEVGDALQVTNVHANQADTVQHMQLSLYHLRQYELQSLLMPGSDFGEKIQGEKFNFELRLDKYKGYVSKDKYTALVKEFGDFYQGVTSVVQAAAGSHQQEALSADKNYVVPQYEKLSDDLNRQQSILSARQNVTELEGAAVKLKVAKSLAWAGMLLLPVLALIVFISLIRRVRDAPRRAILMLEQNAGRLTETIQSLVHSVAESSSALVEIASSAEEFRATADQIMQATLHIKELADQVTQEMQEALEASTQLTTSAKNLQRMTAYFWDFVTGEQQASQQINEINQQLAEVADETHILAINASIEAAAAGANGERFSVIAEEVRHLSDRGSEASNKVRQLVVQTTHNLTSIKKIHDDTDVATHSNYEDASHLKDISTDIARKMLQLQKQLEAIVLGTEQQTIAVENLVEGLHQVQANVRVNENFRNLIEAVNSDLTGLKKMLAQIAGLKERKENEATTSS